MIQSVDHDQALILVTGNTSGDIPVRLHVTDEARGDIPDLENDITLTDTRDRTLVVNGVHIDTHVSEAHKNQEWLSSMERGTGIHSCSNFRGLRKDKIGPLGSVKNN